jgi:hypothetical protein
MRGLWRLVTVAAAMATVGAFGRLGAQEAPDTVVLTGSPLGGVKFGHASHQTMTECTACHHESRPEMPLGSEFQSCAACHTKTPTAPMTTSVRDAFHDATAKTGTCMDCHVAEAAAGKVVPLKCTECHKKSNS